MELDPAPAALALTMVGFAGQDNRAGSLMGLSDYSFIYSFFRPARPSTGARVQSELVEDVVNVVLGGAGR